MPEVTYSSPDMTKSEDVLRDPFKWYTKEYEELFTAGEKRERKITSTAIRKSAFEPKQLASSLSSESGSLVLSQSSLAQISASKSSVSVFPSSG